MRLFLTDHTAEGYDEAYWREPVPDHPESPFTDGSHYDLSAERAANLVRRAGAKTLIVDLENFPADGDERIAVYEHAIGLVRDVYGDSRRQRRNRKPILYFGLLPEVDLWPLHVLDERAGVPRDRREIGRRIRQCLHVAELANCVSIGLYIANGPDREVDGALIPTIRWEIERAVAVAEMWELLAPELPRYVWFHDHYVYKSDGTVGGPVVMPADQATLGAAFREHAGTGLWGGGVLWTPGEPDEGMVEALRRGE